MSYLTTASVTQFATTAACDFVLKQARVEQGSRLCSVLSPAIQAAGTYFYQKNDPGNSAVGQCFSRSSALSPIEEAAASAAGAYGGYQILQSVGDVTYKLLTENLKFIKAVRVHEIQTDSVMRAGVAVMGTQTALHVAEIMKQMYSSQTSSPAEERAPAVSTRA